MKRTRKIARQTYALPKNKQESDVNATRTFRATLFADYFADKERLIEAYNAITGANYPKTAKVEFNTLSNVLINSLQNDISFTIEGRYVVLIEHQSTVNENMPLRLLLYMAHIYESIVPHERLYRKKAFPIPTPQFIVIYNGTVPYPEQKTLRLSDAFIARDGGFALDLSVTVYNIAKGQNAEILKKSKALADYATFISIVNEYRKDGLSLDEAVKKAIHKCAEDGIMETYLDLRGSEVRNMLLTEWNMDDALKYAKVEGKEEGLAEGEAKGLAEGKAEERRASATRMKANGIELSLIAKCTELSLEEIAAL